MKKSSKLLRVVLCALLALCVGFCLFACTPEENADPAPPPSSGDGNETPTPTPPLKEFTGIAFESKTVDYDGSEHSIVVSGTLPDGAKVDYENNAATNAGEYSAKAVLSCDNYVNKTLSATLKINKIDINANITFADSAVEYDTRVHSIYIVGNVPSGVTATYYYNDTECDGVSEPGEYTVRCELSGVNYNTKTLTATLKITATEKLLYSAFVNGKAFFQNDLDGEKLYYYAGSGNVVKVNNDIPNYMIASGNKLYYYSTSLLSKSIKEYDGSAASVLFNLKGEYLATDGTNIYYAVNNLISHTADNGIYKIALSDSGNGDAVPTRLTACKAEYLTYCNGYIYYSNKSDNSYLYRVSVSANDGAGEKLNEEKAEYIISDGTSVYFNSTKTVSVVGVASAVSKYSPSQNKVIKLTTDSGKYLTKIGNFIYYVNNDKLTSAVFGDGIYRVSAALTSDSSAPGTKIVSANGDGYSSLTSDGTYLYYYKFNNKHFYRYNISNQTETDLMADFVPPAETVTLSGYANVTEHGGEIYYTDPTDNSALYKYNPVTKSKFKVLSECVSNVYFDGDYMYYSTYILTNYALFRINLAEREPVSEKIIGRRYENLIFENGKIYCVRITGAGNRIVEIDPETKTETVIYDDKSPSVVGFEKVGNDFYFIMNPSVGYQYIYKYDADSAQAGALNSIKAKNLVVSGNRIYYYGSDEGLKSCDLSGGDIKTIQSGKDINDIYVSGSKVYFSLDNTNKGLYVYDTVLGGSAKKISDLPAHGMVEQDGKLYFLQASVSYTNNYPLHDSSLDGKLYCYDGASVKAV